MEAAAPATEKPSKQAKRTLYERSRAVHTYALARANGACESCGHSAPFIRRNGTPYLESHQTRRLSDGGPDHPRRVEAVCPNCHTEIHHGQFGAQKNKLLEAKLAEIELL
jgi:5-methylcytosine-specific restriction protein A